MNGTFVEQEMRRADRNLLRCCAGALALVMVTLALSHRYFYNYFAGPFPVDGAALAALGEGRPEWRRFVTVRGGRLVPTGIEEITVRRSKRTGREQGRSVSSRFAALTMDGRLLLAKVPGPIVNELDLSGVLPGRAPPQKELSGELVPMPAELRARLLTSAATRAAFFPLMLDCHSYRHVGTGGLVLLGATLLAALGGLVVLLRRRGDGARHPIMARLRTLGEPAALARRIDEERAAGPRRLGDAELTDGFLLRRRPLSLELLRIEDLVWAHGKITKHRVGETHAVVLHDRHGARIEVSFGTGRRAQVGEVKEILSLLAARAPWAIFGHSAELERRWSRAPSELIAAAAARREAAARA